MNDPQPKTILFFGPSGAGKGTQVQLLIDALKSRSDAGVVYVEMGGLLRGLIAKGGHTAELTDEVLKVGALMPAFLPVHLMAEKLANEFTGGEHIIADGVVRRPDQARAWDDAMIFYGRENYEVLVLELSDASIMERLLLRGRNDDTEEAIRTRIGWYKDEVEPLLKFIEEKGRTIHHIDGEPTVEEIHQNILTTLGLQ